MRASPGSCVGTAALEEPDFVRRLAARHRRWRVGLDVRGREVAVRGWERGSGLDVVERWPLRGAGVAASS